MCETRVALHCCGFCWVAFCAPLHFASIDFMCVFFVLHEFATLSQQKKSVVVYLFHTKRFSLFSLFYAWPTLPEIRKANPKCVKGVGNSVLHLAINISRVLRVEKDWREWDTSHEYSGRGNGTTPDLSEVTCIHALLRQVSYSFNGLYGFNHLPFSRTDKKEKIRRQRRRKWLFWMIMILGWMTFICIYEKRKSFTWNSLLFRCGFPRCYSF